jgi:BioD-like phosphotransacetylase family protein
LAQTGRSPALIRPIRLDGGYALHPDAAFDALATLGGADAASAPMSVARDAVADASLPARVREMVGAASAGKQLTIVEGLDGLGQEDPVATASSAIAEALGAPVALVLDYRPDLGEAEARAASQLYGERLLGAVVNRVPGHARNDAATRLSSAFQSRGVRILGLVPEDRRMAAPSVAQVAEHLGAEFRVLDGLEDPEGSLRALVEYFMVGGAPLDNGAYVFSRRENKAALMRGDRPDLQMAALQTSTACLVLTEGHEPIQYVTHHAALRQIPMMMVGAHTLDVMEALGDISERVTVHNPLKTERFADLLDRHGDISTLLAVAEGA